jgi:hypothetical protein
VCDRAVLRNRPEDEGMTGELIPKGLRDLVDCDPLDKFIKEQNPDLPNISNYIDIIARKQSVSFLIKGDIANYKKFLEDFNLLHIPDHRPSVFTAFKDSFFSDMPISLPNYMGYFKKTGFCNQNAFTEYLKIEFKRLGFGFTEEFETGFGRCDFLIRNNNPFLLELKPWGILKKDIYQCHEYRKCKGKKYPIVILGNSIVPTALELAKEMDVGVYLYTIVCFAPTRIETTRACGSKYPSLEKIWHSQFLGVEGRIAKELGWSDSP